MPLYSVKSLPKDKYSNLFIVAAFSRKSFPVKISLQVENPDLLIFLNNKAEILAVCLPKSY